MSKYKRIDNRLVLEMVRPNQSEFGSWRTYHEAMLEWESRPSFEINPSDLDKFNFVDGYERDVDFMVEDIMIDKSSATNFNPKLLPVAFALPKDNDMSGEDDKREIEISAQIELLQGYYNKIFMNKMSVEDILNSLERDREFLQEEQNIISANRLLNPKK